jgi:hypothetical protein
MARAIDELGGVHPDDLLPDSIAPDYHHSYHPSQVADPQAPRPQLRLVDGTTGELLCEDCQHYKTEAERALQQLAEAERELRSYRSKVTRLENERDNARAKSPKRPIVQDIFNYWKEQTGHPNSKLTDDRFDAVEKWLKKYKPEEIKWAIAYIGAYPYRGEFGTRKAEGTNAERKDGITMICDIADRFEQWANEGYRLLKKRGDLETTKLFD